MNALLLGGWRHVADDVRRLAKGLSMLSDTCACGCGSAHLSGTCRCCLDRARSAGSGCPDCEALLGSIHDDIDELVDATLRFLPFVESQTVVNGDINGASGVGALRRQIFSVAEAVERLEAAAGEFRDRSGPSHMGALRTLANDLAAATKTLDAQLTATSAHANPSRVVGA